MKDSRRKDGGEGSTIGDASRRMNQECALHPNECNGWNVTDHSLAHICEEGSRNLELLGVVVEGKQKGNDGEKGDGSTTTRNTTTTFRSPSEPIKRYRNAGRALFRHHHLAYLTLPCSIVGLL
jgi:hypothetical protein